MTKIVAKVELKIVFKDFDNLRCKEYEEHYKELVEDALIGLETNGQLNDGFNEVKEMSYRVKIKVK